MGFNKEFNKGFNIEKVSVVGLGYIGLPTAAVLSELGVQVHGLDSKPEVVKAVNSGEIHILEPGLGELLKISVGKTFRASLEAQASDVFVIAVPTPFKKNHEPDLSHIESALKKIAPVLKSGNLVILESTSPVGTTKWMGEILKKYRGDLKIPDSEKNSDCDIHLAYCPERVLPGRILHELKENNRVIGGLTPACTSKAFHFYKLFVSGECIKTSARMAEMVKLTENSFRDVNIAFANELSLICDSLNLNVRELIQLSNFHPRVNILNPGPGVGGHCIAVDPWFIIHKNPKESRLIQMAREVNDYKPEYVTQKILKSLPLKSSKVGCLGLSFKSDIDDLRGSPAVDIVARLAQHGVTVLVVEPHISYLPESLHQFKNIEICSLESAIEKCDVIALLVDHKAFSSLTLKDFKDKILIDTRGVIL